MGFNHVAFDRVGKEERADLNPEASSSATPHACMKRSKLNV